LRSDFATCAKYSSAKRREEGIRVLPPIPIFKFNRHAKIADLANVTSKASTRRKGRALIGRLSELAPEERVAEIERLSAQLYELGAERDSRSMYLDTIDNIKEVGAVLADYSLFPVRSVWGLVKILVSVGRRLPAIDRFIDALQQDLTPEQFRHEDLDFLSTVELRG